ncbi:YidH family protein [Photobacterium satsumensis]|uniref:YidH family protein n=1 Tax=Photobacterium satsumensis TaxID=2910239 RepID=UPI003D0D1CBF
MKNTQQRSKIAWRNEGEAPDYRFSLANERTYLAWIRTALALLAGAIGIDQLTPDLANPTVRILISSFLCLCSGLLAVFAYRRWALNEKAMRTKAELHYTGFLKLISIIMLFLTAVVILVITL